MREMETGKMREHKWRMEEEEEPPQRLMLSTLMKWIGAILVEKMMTYTIIFRAPIHIFIQVTILIRVKPDTGYPADYLCWII